MATDVVAGLRLLALFLWYWLEAIMRWVSPASKAVEGEVVLVTGAGSGLGRLLSLEFAKLGATVIAWDLNGAAAEETARLCRELSKCPHRSYVVDVSHKDQVYAAAAVVRREVGPVTILINNAGIVAGDRLLSLPDEKIEKTFQINAISHFWTVKAFLKDMKAKNHGHIVSIASMAGKRGVDRLTDYCASKFAAVGFAESLADELYFEGYDGINTTIVCPYFISTGMFSGADAGWFDFLTPEYVTNRIIAAVRSNQFLLVLPRFMYFSNFFMECLPHKCFQLVCSQLVGTPMVSFVGRNGIKKD